MNFFLQACTEKGLLLQKVTVSRLHVTHIAELGMSVAHGGLGKVQFAVQTQHLIGANPGWELVICAGAAGALVNHLATGDVVVATETVEHDIRNKFGTPLLPRFPSAAAIVEAFQRVPQTHGAFQVHYGPIASGDEDVIDHQRRNEIQQLTGALVVAWEGAGGARACHFNGIPYLEVRSVTDGADSTAASDFETNLHVAMKNVAAVVTAWAQHHTSVAPNQLTCTE
jgi:adenosylhomocysteine nucleosidase